MVIAEAAHTKNVLLRTVSQYEPNKMSTRAPFGCRVMYPQKFRATPDQ